jgi:hypothetical protein
MTENGTELLRISFISSIVEYREDLLPASEIPATRRARMASNKACGPLVSVFTEIKSRRSGPIKRSALWYAKVVEVECHLTLQCSDEENTT